MGRQSEFVTLLKRAGIVLCFLLILALSVSLLWRIEWTSRGQRRWVGSPHPAPSAPWGILPAPGWSVRRNDEGLRCGPWGTGKSRWARVGCSLWIPTAVAVVFTGILWRLGRRPRPGYCRICGYDSTGNTTGVCPECGSQLLAGVSKPATRCCKGQNPFEPKKEHPR